MMIPLIGIIRKTVVENRLGIIKIQKMIILYLI